MRYIRIKNVRVFHVAFVATLLLVVATILLLCHNGGPVSVSGYMRIKKEMTSKEVFELLGPPSDNNQFLIPIQGTQPPPKHQSDLPEFQELLDASWKNWITKECTIAVIFDANGKVIGKGFIEYTEHRNWIMRFLDSL